MALPFVFTSCSNDDDENNDSLNGTTWVYEDYEYGDEKPSFTVTMKFKETTYTYEGVEDFIYEFSGSGTYVYNKPTVTMVEGGETTKCTVSGNKMIVEGGDGFVYIKQ